MPNKIQQKPNSRFLLIKRSLPPLPQRRSFSSRLHGSPVVASLGGEGGAELRIVRVACLDGCGRQHEDGDGDFGDRQHDWLIKSFWIPESIWRYFLAVVAFPGIGFHPFAWNHYITLRQICVITKQAGLVFVKKARLVFVKRPRFVCLKQPNCRNLEKTALSLVPIWGSFMSIGPDFCAKCKFLSKRSFFCLDGGL